MKTLGNSVIYENVLYVCATKNAEKNQLFLAALQLDGKVFQQFSFYLSKK